MAVQEMRTRFKLEGEQEYKRAMSESAAAIKVLDSETKLATAQFKANGDAQAFAAEKSRILKEQIAQQETAVKTAEAAVKKLTEQGVSPNSKEMQKWQTSLNEAKAKLTTMKTELNQTETEFGQQETAITGAKDATHDFNTEMGKVAEGVSLQNTIDAIDNITTHIENVVRGAARAGRAIWEMGTDSAAWADGLLAASTQMGISLHDLQGWEYAAKFVDTEVSTIQAAMVRLVNPAQAATEAMQDLGVQLKDKGEDRSRQDIFWDTIEAISALGDVEQQEQMAQTIFGKKFSELKPLIEAGREAWEGYVAEAEEAGYILSDDKILALGGLDDSVQRMQTSFETLKNSVMAELSPALQTVATTITQVTDKLIEWAQSEEGQEALSSLGDAVSSVITALTGEVDFTSLVESAARGVSALKDGFNWIKNNGRSVATVIGIMATAYAGLKITKEVLLFMTLLKNTPLANLSSVFGGGKVPTVPTVPTGSSVGTSVGTSVAPAVATGGATWLSTAVSTVAPWLIGLTAGAFTLYKGQEQMNRDAEARARNEEQREQRVAAEAVFTGDDQYTRAYTAIAEARRQIQEAGEQGAVTEELIAAVTGSDAFREAAALAGYGGTNFAQEWRFNGGMNRLFGGYGNTGIFGDMLESIDEQAEDLYDQMDTTGTEAVKRLNQSMGDGLADTEAEVESMAENLDYSAVDGMLAAMDEVSDASSDVAQSAVDAARDTLDEHSPSKVFEAIGKNASLGLARGINAKAGDAIRAAQSLADTVAQTIRGALDIHSPSRVTEKLGELTGEGFIVGLQRSGGQKLAESVSSLFDAVNGSRISAEAAAGEMLSAVEKAQSMEDSGTKSRNPGGGNRGGGSSSGSGGSGTPTIKILLMMDKDILAETLVPIVDENLGARLQARR